MLDQSLGADPLASADIQDPAAGVHAYLWHEHWKKFVAALAISTCVCGGLLALEWAGTGSLVALAANGGQALLVPFIIYIWPLSIYVAARAKIRRAFLGQIASALGLSYAATDDARNVTSKFLSTGHNEHMSGVMSGTYAGHPLRIYDFSRTVGYGKSAHTDVYTVFELSFEKHLPDIILYPKGTGIFGLDDTGTSFDGSAVELEGDFGRYFVLRAPKGYEMEIRIIFQPDLMAMLIDQFKGYLIELFGNKLYVLRPPLSTKAGFSETFALVNLLYAKLTPVIAEVGTTAPIPPAKAPFSPLLSPTAEEPGPSAA